MKENRAIALWMSPSHYVMGVFGIPLVEAGRCCHGGVYMRVCRVVDSAMKAGRIVSRQRRLRPSRIHHPKWLCVKN